MIDRYKQIIYSINIYLYNYIDIQKVYAYHHNFANKVTEHEEVF